ncbi:MAG: hypothetical protein LBV58_01195 [Acholeplasmatales bacterium]|jgi:hypothetical protein|nr:hypothetical protein [Acholeplasmatales bacterium]
MYCFSCKKNVKKRINLSNLFEKEYHFICENCFEKYELRLGYEVIPGDTSDIYHFYLFDEKIDIDSNAFSSFFQRYLITFIKNKNKMTILWYDYIKDEVVKLLIKLDFGNLFIISIY